MLVFAMFSLTVLAFLLLIPIYMTCRVKINSDIQQVVIGLGPFKRKHFYRKYIPLKPKYHGLFYIERFKIYTKTAKRIQLKYFDILSYAKAKLIVERIHIDLDIGFEDAAMTAIFCGGFIGICDFLYQKFRSQIKILDYDRNVYPIFDRGHIDMDLACIMSIRTGYIIIVVLKILYSNMVKAVKQKWQINTH